MRSPVQNLIENMVWTIFYDISNKRSSNQITMGLLFLQLLNYMDKMEAGGRKFDTEIMANVYRYIEDHFKEGHPVRAQPDCRSRYVSLFPGTYKLLLYNCVYAPGNVQSEYAV